MKTHNSSRIIFSGRTLAIKTVTVYTVKSNANHTLFGNAIHSFSSVVIASSTLAINIGLLISPTMICKRQINPRPSESKNLAEYFGEVRKVSFMPRQQYRAGRL